MSWIIRLGIQRGLLGGNRFFAALGVAGLLLRLVTKLAGTGPRTIYKEKLEPGQVLVIREQGSRR